MIKKTTNKITKIDITKASDLIAARGEIPTIAAVRAELQGRGSETTIHKYLQAWKKAKLLAKPGSNSVNHDQELLFIEEKRNLEQALQQQIIQNENYAQELISAEKANVTLKEKNYQLEATIQELNLELTKVTAVNHILEKLTKEIQQQLAINENDVIKKQKLIIDELQQELKNLSAKSLATIQELSSKGHESLMQEKVNSINWQAKIDSLQKELAESKKQLQEATLTSQVQIRSLARQNEQMQKIIQDHDLYKTSLIDQELNLSFNPKTEEDCYGK